MRDIQKIRRLVGDISSEQMAHVDYAVTDELGAFMPVTGQCRYATTPEHTHPMWSFIVSFDEYCRTRIGSTLHDSLPSTIFALAPDTPHQELPSETLSRYVAVMIDTRFLQAQLAVYGKPLGEIRNAMVCPSSQRLIDELKEFMTEYEEAIPGFDAMMKATALKITHLVIRQFLEIKHPDCVIIHRMAINKALDFLNEKYGEKISIRDLATSAGCSVSHFSRLFKDETGIAPSDYVMKVRLDRAKRMLRADEMSVTQIALACGFNSSAYFSHCFSRAFGISPSDFRKSLELT